MFKGECIFMKIGNAIGLMVAVTIILSLRPIVFVTIYKSLIQPIEKKKEELRLEVLKYVGYQNQNICHKSQNLHTIYILMLTEQILSIIQIRYVVLI